MDIENKIRQLAKSIRSMNLFSASKEIQGIHIFKNSYNFSKIQSLYLSYLYFYYNLNTDVALEKVSKKVLDSEINEDSYAIWKQNTKEKDKKAEEKTNKNLFLVFGKDKYKEE
ncbi:MAG: hypothetical protein V1901_03815 [Patescibacteria group bacterium]